MTQDRINNTVFEKYLKCPFCGEEDIAEIECETGLKLGCTNCSAETDYFDWNNRV